MDRVATRHQHERGAAMTRPSAVALQIGAAYNRACGDLIEAGKLLAGVKATLTHGEWLPWLKANASALGFDSDRTAQRLIKLAANPSSTSDLWGNCNRGNGDHHLFTTVEHIALVKTVFGGEIDLDPSSCQEANDKYVKARTFYTKEKDGLKYPWPGRVYLNPMYDNDSMLSFVDKLIVELGNGNCIEAILLSSNKLGSQWGRKVLQHASAICFPNDFVPFHAPETGRRGTPAYCVFSYFGPNHEKFTATFREIGAVVKVL